MEHEAMSNSSAQRLFVVSDETYANLHRLYDELVNLAKEWLRLYAVELEARSIEQEGFRRGSTGIWSQAYDAAELASAKRNSLDKHLVMKDKALNLAMFIAAGSAERAVSHPPVIPGDAPFEKEGAA
jgi:hypothetical protein